MSPRSWPTLVLLVITVLCTALRAEEEPKDDEPKSYEGTVVSAKDEKLVIKVGDDEYTIEVNDETSIKFDGEDAELEDLKEGHFAKVTVTEKDDKLTAKAIDARAAQ